jgi:hypothetical protein
MSEDIVDRLTAWVEHEARETDPARAILDARDAIVAARKALMNLSAAVVGSDTLEEARSIAWKLAPLDDRSVLIQGFHEVEALWRFDPKTVEGFKPAVLSWDSKPAKKYETVNLSQLLMEIAGRINDEQDADAIRLAACTLDGKVMP